jgi:hypothetical protein
MQPSVSPPAPLKKVIPLPLAKGEGIQGMGFTNLLAERVGFEPTVGKPHTRSPGAPDSPLQHLSTRIISVR